jgi:hypothetical protein
MKKAFLIIFFSGWVIGLSYTLTKMHSWHVVSFKQQSLQDQLNSFFKNKNAQKGVFHILASDCGCSQIIAEHLIKRGTKAELPETIIMLGEFEEHEEKLKARGFNVKHDTEFDSFISGVPLLVVHDENRNVLYQGGYAKKIVTPVTPILEQEIIKNALNHIKQKKYPVMGCATSEKIQKVLDPLNLKYKKVTDVK